MSQEIKNLINDINDGLNWIKQNRPDQYETQFLLLVEERRRLKKVLEIERDNPAIAAYGKSQVGKSYLMNNMLQQEYIRENGTKAIKQFEVQADGVNYIFINDINPITKDSEATGVVTRFSSFSREPSRYEPSHPVLMKTLSVSDMILILSDGYFNDVEDSTSDSRNEIDEKAEELYGTYINEVQIVNPPLTADDILEMKDYFHQYIKKAQELNKSNFFDKIALVIDRIPVGDYVKVFSYLWNGQENFTWLLRKIMGTLSALNFQRDVYLNIDSVLHKGQNENTIMSVQCLDGLVDDDSKYSCDAFLKQTDGTFKQISNLKKSELSAVCAEIVYRISPEFLSSTKSYAIEDIVDPNTLRNLTKGDITFDFLKNADLLDFPGARTRKCEKSSTLSEGKILTNVLLRGKVAFLFNKYTESRAINILLYCHDYMMCDVTQLYITLKGWIEKFIGSTPEARQTTLRIAGNISPLFYIATKFNADLASDQNPTANTRTAIDGRWLARFQKVLYKECFNADSVEWVKNWTAPGVFFQNSFLLRDFKYSGPKVSKLYSGFAETGKEQELVVDGGREYMDLMRESFCNSEHVKMFFDNPSKAWDVATTLNNDGALYIIEQLAKAAAALDAVRNSKIMETLMSVSEKVLKLLKEFYVTDDTAELLQENIRKANDIFRDLEFACQSDPECFGHLLKALQVSESQAFTALHKLIPTLGEIVNDTEKIADYELIRKRCGNFEGCKNEVDKWNIFIKCYNFNSIEDANSYLIRKNIDPQKLFRNESLKRKNSAVITDKLLSLWRDKISGVQVLNEFCSDNKIDSYVMSNLSSCLMSAAKSVDLNQKIEDKITDYVDILKTSNINESLVADIIATTISDFVTDFGYRYLDDSQVQSLNRVIKDYGVNNFGSKEIERKETYNELEMTDLLNNILNSVNLFTPAYEANYNAWLDNMYAAFIAHLNVQDYDHEANTALKVILDNIKA